MYQALYRKYRPQTFDDVVGQASITQTLKNQLVSQRLSHAYLFTGTRGTGKTTCAKILAKAVNCLEPIDGNPCNHCAACRSIDSGACMDVLEIDAASNNGVDHVRALRDEAIYSPSEVKKRVYIIDEVHMLSISAFNALLKIIEEPPAHLLFILATTELHKVPVTILSRCQRFSFRRILPEDIVGRLNEVAHREHLELLPEAAAFLARLADGGMRDALSLLDQCASAVNGPISTQEVCRVLGLAGTRMSAELLKAVAEHNTAAALSIFNRQYAEGKDLSAMLDELCAVCRDLLMLRTAPKSVSMISGICTEEELDDLLPRFGAGELLRMTRVLRDAAAGFSTSANRRIDAELCIIRLCEPEAATDAEALNARISRLENHLASGHFVSAEAKPTEPQEETPPWDDDDAPPAREADENVPPPPQPTPSAPAGFWPSLVEKLRATLKPPAVAMFVVSENAPVMGVLQGDGLILECRDDFTVKIIQLPNVLQTVGDCAAALLGRSVKVAVRKIGEHQKNNEGFDRLLRFGQQHPEIVDLK